MIAGARADLERRRGQELPAGTLFLAGTDPTCTAVKDGVEYRCQLAKAPAPEVSDWTGTVEPTVDQKIIGAGFLGDAPSPGQG